MARWGVELANERMLPLILDATLEASVKFLARAVDLVAWLVGPFIDPCG